MTAQLLLGLSILVGLHEFGHLLAAKAFGMSTAWLPRKGQTGEHAFVDVTLADLTDLLQLLPDNNNGHDEQ